MHDTARSERFSYSCSVVALRAAMETVDSEGLAASAAAAVQVGLLLYGNKRSGTSACGWELWGIV